MLVTAWVVAVLLTRAPEALAEREFAKRGEESPAAQDRRQRLIDAGIDPATGGAFRQYVGNAWRDAWLDLDEQRRTRRANRPPVDSAGPSLWERFRGRIDAAVDRRAQAWRRRVADSEPRRSSPGRGDDEPFDDRWADLDPGSGADGWRGRESDGERRDEDTDRTFDGEWADPDPAEPAGPDHPADRTPRAEPTRSGNDHAYRPPPRPTQPQPPPAGSRDDRAEQDRAPLRGTITVERPQPDPPTKGDPMSSLVRAGAVTGVLSGAAEARAVQRQLEAANTAYVAELARVRARITSLGEQTLSTVQMAQRSNVVSLLVQSAEAAAAAQAAARTCGAEVAPLLGQVARAFERLNS